MMLCCWKVSRSLSSGFVQLCPVSWGCPDQRGSAGRFGLAHVLLSWDVLVLCSSFEAVLTLGPTVGVWHFGQCLGRCEQCWEFDVISKWSSRGWLLFFQLLKVNSWTYCFCTNPNRLVGGTQCAPDERNLAITSLRGGSVKLQRNEMGR